MITQLVAPHDNSAGSVKSVIARTVAAVCERHWGERMRACVLTGSLARDEATIIHDQGVWKALGDAEFLAVFHQDASLPADEDIRLLCREIATSLMEQGIICLTTVSPVPLRYLRRMRPHIFGYELRACGQIVSGDRDILSLIPDFSPSDIPLEDAWRLLNNRMIEVLEAAGQGSRSAEALTYRASKLCLDMATSFLLFSGAYEPGYRKRAERIAGLAKVTSHTHSPFPSLQAFAHRVAACTDFKLGIAAPQSSPDTITWQQTVEDVRVLWKWEFARLAGLPETAADDDLWQRTLRQQTWADKLRGWAYVLRQSGWHRSHRNWLHWLFLAAEASPRYCVYRVASALFFDLPLTAHPDNDIPSTLKTLRTKLPVPTVTEDSSWCGIASSVAWNYHQFLELTRS